MAQSQLQCLDESHVNVRINESKPEFLYSEEQRLALETLVDHGAARFEQFITAHSVRPFLSDLELARYRADVELCKPASDDSLAGVNGVGEETDSLQYWPDRSDSSLPDLDLGWPERASYRGVSRVSVYPQPPLQGQTHIKEVIRKTIAQAQKVIAVVMDLFTDMDIFRDLLNACYRRKVAVYIILEATGVPHFLKMCERSVMHTGHLKNLRVRSVRGTEFFTRSSKKVCGSQSQKFMFVDGDKAVSGSYSFTWSASRLDRNIITVLTGQAVDVFDELFRDLYLKSNGVNLDMINLDKEPKLDPAPQSTPAPAPAPSASVALKLINPKYALVSGSANATSNCTRCEKLAAEVGSVPQTKELQEASHLHPALLHLEKADMIHYLPVWPEPDPPSDVIGFINIRDYNKPLQAHLMRSELFEISQAIRFKEPFHVPEEPLPDKACPKPRLESVCSTTAFEEQQIAPNFTESDENTLHPKTHKEEQDSALNQSMEQHKVCTPKQTEETCVKCQGSAKSGEKSADSWVSVNSQLRPVTSASKPAMLVSETTHTSCVQYETTSFKQSSDIAAETLCKNVQNDEKKTVKDLGPDSSGADSVVRYSSETAIYPSSFSSTSEYFECSNCLSVDLSGFKGTGFKGPSEQCCRQHVPNNAVTCCLSSPTLQIQRLTGMRLMSGSCERETSDASTTEREQCDAQHITGVTNSKSSEHPELKDTEAAFGTEDGSWTEPVCKAQKQQGRGTDHGSKLQGEDKVIGNSPEATTDALDSLGEKEECTDGKVETESCNMRPEEYSVINDKFVAEFNPKHSYDHSQLAENTTHSPSALLHGLASPPLGIQKNAEAQPVVKEVPLLVMKPEHWSEFTYTSSLQAARQLNDTKAFKTQEKAATFHFHITPNPNTAHDKNGSFPTHLTINQQVLIVEDSDYRQEIKTEPVMKKSTSSQTVDTKVKAQTSQRRTLPAQKVAQHNRDVPPPAGKHTVRSKEKPVGEHTCKYRENKKFPAAKPKLEENARKYDHLTSPKPVRTCREASSSPTKASADKLHSSNHPCIPAAPRPGAHKYPHGKVLEHNRTINAVPTSLDKISSRRTAPSGSTQTQPRRSRTEPSPSRQISPLKQPEAQPDRTRAVQLGQWSSRQRSASTKEHSPRPSGTSFPRRSRAVKEKITASSPSNATRAQSLKRKEQEKFI